MAYDAAPHHASAALALSPLSARSAAEITPSDFVQYRNRANVGILRTRYALVVVASESIVCRMKRSMKRNVPATSLWGRVLADTHTPDVAGAAAVAAFPRTLASEV